MTTQGSELEVDLDNDSLLQALNESLYHLRTNGQTFTTKFMQCLS